MLVTGCLKFGWVPVPVFIQSTLKHVYRGCINYIFWQVIPSTQHMVTEQICSIV